MLSRDGAPERGTAEQPEITYDHVVVGGGPMGASAAAYLAEDGHQVALVTPAEGPGPDRRFSSHGDLSRVARNWSGDPVWRTLGQRSIDRFRQIEDVSGVRFFHEVGSLLLLPPEARKELGQVTTALRGADGDRFERLSAASLRQRFAYLDVCPRSVGVLEQASAGHFDPRAFVRAQIRRGQEQSLAHVEASMERLDTDSLGHRVVLADGMRISARKVLLAQGSYSRFEPTCPVADQLTIYGRTIIHIEVDDEARRALARMPSLRLHEANYGFYLLPPMEYPDGKHYLKIGGGPRTQVLSSPGELEQWMVGPGDPAVIKLLLDRTMRLLPDVAPVNVRPQTCIITVPRGGHPYIVRGADGVGAVTGGNGAGAKSGDELGRLAAAMMTGTPDWSQDYEALTFQP